MASKKLRINDELVEYTFEEVYEKYTPYIRYRAKMIQSELSTVMSYEDALSDCILGFWNAYEHYNCERECSFLSFANLCMWRICSTKFAAGKRYHGKEEDICEWTHLTDTSDFERDSYFKDSLSEVIEFMNNGGISKRQLEVMTEYMKGKTYEEIMETLGLTRNQVRGAINTARATLRKRFPDIFEWR